MYTSIWRNRFLAIIGTVIFNITLWLIFKYLYPYPDLVFDSYHYINAAVEHRNVNAWPIGYSWYLSLFRFFSGSVSLFVSFQYFLLEAACLVFYISWRILYSPSRLISVLFLFLLFFNPLFMFCSNFIMADTLFISLSLLWFIQLLWLLHRPKAWMVITNALLLVVAFTVRYNALYYPLVAMIAFTLCRLRLWQKVLGAIFPLVLISVFVFFTRAQMASVCGTAQFSPFAGWKLANDALFGYGHLVRDGQADPPDKLYRLDSVVRHYFRTTKNREELLQTEMTAGSPFMFFEDSPLLEYMYFDKGPGGLPFNNAKWMSVAPLYQTYGSYLIRKYPSSFARHFLLPNTFRYFVPPGENLPSTEPFYFHESVENRAVREGFGFNAKLPKHPAIRLQRLLLAPFPFLFLFFHLAFIIGLLGFICTRGLKRRFLVGDLTVLLVLVLWIVDFAFSVFSAGVVLRYEIFVGIIEMGMGLYFMEQLYQFLDLKK